VAHAQAKRYIFSHCQMRKKRVILKHQPKIPLIAGDMREVLSLPANTARIRRLDPGNDAQKGAFPAAGTANQT
jgi:hypothetical protein